MANLGHPHLNDRGEVCYCGFGKNQPSVSWHVGAIQVIEEKGDPWSVGDGRPFIYDEDNSVLHVGPGGSGHWELLEQKPELEGQPMGRQEGQDISWFGHPFEPKDQEEVEHALGGKSESDRWDFTEPMATEPTDEHDHHQVEISNDKPGVPTIGE